MAEDNEQSKTNVPATARETQATMAGGRMVPPSVGKSPFNIRDLVSIFFKHKRAMVVTFITVLLLAALYPLLIYKPKYQARSVLLVKYGWENLTTDPLPDSKLPESRRPLWINMTEVMLSEAGIIKSREVKEKAVSVLRPENIFPELAVKPYPGLTSSEAACVLIEKDLTVNPDKGNTLMVTFAGDNPERASMVVNQIVDSYIERRGEIYKDPKSQVFLEKKAEEYAQKLADAEKRLKAFRAETNIVSFDEQRAFFLKQQYDLAYSRGTAEDSRKGITEKIAELQAQMSRVPKFSQSSEEALSYRVQGTEQKVLDLKLLERELAAKYKDDNKLLIGARERLKIATDFLENQRKIKPAEVMDPVYKELQKQELSAKAELNSLNAKVEHTDHLLADLSAELQRLDGLEQKYKALVREVSDNTEKYRSYKQKIEEGRISDELNRQKMTSVSIIERASPSNIPANPFKPLIIFIPIVLAIAVFGGLVAAFTLEMLSHSLSTPTDAEKRLNLPVLVTISAR